METIIDILSISLIFSNFLFLFLSILSLKNTIVMKYKLKHKLMSFSLIIIFSLNIFYFYNAC